MPSVLKLTKPPTELFKEHRIRLAKALSTSHTVALLASASTIQRHSADTSYPFYQETCFQWLFGFAAGEDCLGALDLSTGEGILFIPRLPEHHAVWMGALKTPPQAVDETGNDVGAYTDEVVETLRHRGVQKVLLLCGRNSDSGNETVPASALGLEDAFECDHSSLLYDALTKQRLYKSPLEVEMFQSINSVSSAGHIEVMKQIKPGMTQDDMVGIFTGFVIRAGCKNLAYTPICASGVDNSILHFCENNKPLVDGQLALMDLGGDYESFSSDITTTFPVNGRFTSEQRGLYNTVLRAHNETIQNARPGVSWVDLHLEAMRLIGVGLRELELIHGTDEELMQHEVLVTFFPHGLGHLIGLDVHDPAGYASDTPPRGTSATTKFLRTARTLEKDFYITVEPGCYFNAILLEAALGDPVKSKYLNEAKIRLPEWWNIGGVRIESDVLICGEGPARSLTVVPRTVEEIEEVMNCKSPRILKPEED